MTRRKILTGLCGLTLGLSLTACGSKENNENPPSSESGSQISMADEKTDIMVFAAASMTDVLEDIKEVYEKDHPVNLSFSFDSSGTLKSQILEGADCDVFISAAQKQMDELDPSQPSYNGKVSIDKDTRMDLLENKVCLVVSDTYDKDIKSFKDLDSDKLESLALGNEDVPVGQYSEEILKNLGIWDKIQDKISFGLNVREVATWVNENTVDAGIIYATDAKVFGLKVIDEADSSILTSRVIYPAAVLDNSKNKKEAQEFLQFLQGDTAKEMLTKRGFSPL